MKINFRDFHLLNLIKAYDDQHLPLDLFISIYFRNNTSLGSKDRAYIAENLYGMIRWKGLLDYLCVSPPTWEERYKIYSSINPCDYQNEAIPAHIKVSFPKVLFDLLVKSHGLAKAEQLCLISNQPAPTTIRVNDLKTNRESMLKAWASAYDVVPTLFSQTGINFNKKINFFGLKEFKEGLFEVQDEGSQLLADMVGPLPGQLVLDYCAGSGGKTLAFAPKLHGQGQIYLHDIRSHALQEARKRLRRAGIQNAQIIQPDSTQLSKLKKKMHWVLADVPCTGTGTMRRNPDMKWKFDEITLSRLLGQQRTIFERALSYMHPTGRIVYGTCSILDEENLSQIEHFKKTYGLEIEGAIFQSLPSVGGMDGFFGAILKYT